MQLGMIGLGRMGGNMALRLLRDNHEIVVLDRGTGSAQPILDAGATAVAQIASFRTSLSAPRAVWMMVPAGDATESTLSQLLDTLEPGDVIVDGGNANFKESIARAKRCAARNIAFVDAGVSGGIWGLENGYCIMAGGDPAAISTIRPVCTSLAPPDGFAHVGPVGAGHFVKMVHNGIEYGMMQALAEGFELLHARDEFSFDLHQIAKVWQQGSVVRSWLLDLTERALGDANSFADIRGYVQDSGEGRWTVESAIESSVPLPVITAALFSRFASRQDESFAARINAALRNQFGGHAVQRSDGELGGVRGTPQAKHA